MKFWVTLMIFLGLAAPAYAACTTTKPGPDWVCVNGNWLPPGSTPVPAPAPVVATTTTNITPPSGYVPIWPPAPAPDGVNKWIIDAARKGETLPPGEIWFSAPLVLKDIAVLKGTAGRTILKPIGLPTGALIIVQTSLPGSAESGYPLRQQISDLVVACSNKQQSAFDIYGAALNFSNITVTQCGEGMRFSWAVNVTVSESHFIMNTTGLLFAGQPSGINDTTVRVRDCEISSSSNAAVVLWHGMSITFDNTIMEYNGRAVAVLPQGAGVSGVVLRDVWLEGNTYPIYDVGHVIRYEGTTAVH